MLLLLRPLDLQATHRLHRLVSQLQIRDFWLAHCAAFGQSFLGFNFILLHFLFLYAYVLFGAHHLRWCHVFDWRLGLRAVNSGLFLLSDSVSGHSAPALHNVEVIDVAAVKSRINFVVADRDVNILVATLPRHHLVLVLIPDLATLLAQGLCIIEFFTVGAVVLRMSVALFLCMAITCFFEFWHFVCII